MQAIYFDDNVLITQNIATIFGTSYPISAITSLNIKEIKGQVSSFITFLFFIIFMFGLIVFVFGLSVVFDETRQFTSSSLLALVPGAAVMFGIWYLAGKTNTPPPSDYFLTIRTADGTHAEIFSSDPRYVQTIRAAIEHAIHLR